MGRPGLRDVAALAGTSTAVVSYVVNGGPRPVAPATRRRVEDAIAALGYRPNGVARSLRTRRTGTLGLVVPDLAKAFFAELAAAAETAALGQGRRLLVASSRFDVEREVAQLRALLDSQVDGIALVPAGDPAASAHLLRGSGVAWVLLHRHPYGDLPAVAGADHEAGRAAAQHLLGHGHRVLACLSGPEAGSPVQERTAGFRAAVAGALGRVDDDLVVACGYERLHEAAYEATRDLLARRPDVTAVCATTDEHALGVYRAAAEHGRRIGETLAVVSIDGTNQTAYLTPGLTVVAAPFAGMAAQAVDRLVTQAAGPGEPLPLRLVVRESCGCRG